MKERKDQAHGEYRRCIVTSAHSRVPGSAPVFLYVGSKLIYRSPGFEWRPHRTDAKVGGQGHTTYPLLRLPRPWGSVLSGFPSLAGSRSSRHLVWPCTTP